MPTFITGLESQPDFPVADLSESNAELLELMLANADLVRQGHLRAEQASWIFRAGHPAMRTAASRIFSDSSYTGAFDHGISSYETIAAFIQTTPEPSDMFAVNANAIGISSKMQDDKLYNYIDFAAQKFEYELPRTAEVVLVSSQRVYREIARYAVYGAAMARQFELDGTG